MGNKIYICHLADDRVQGGHLGYACVCRVFTAVALVSRRLALLRVSIIAVTVICYFFGLLFVCLFHLMIPSFCLVVNFWFSLYF